MKTELLVLNSQTLEDYDSRKQILHTASLLEGDRGTNPGSQAISGLSLGLVLVMGEAKAQAGLWQPPGQKRLSGHLPAEMKTGTQGVCKEV